MILRSLEVGISSQKVKRFKNFRTVCVLRKEWTWVQSIKVWKFAVGSTQLESTQRNSFLWKGYRSSQTSRTTFILKEFLKNDFRVLLVERLSRSKLDWDEVRILICKSFFFDNWKSERRVANTWRRYHSTSRVKENTTLNEDRDTSDFSAWLLIHTNHKTMTEWSNISIYIYMFFRV